MNEQNKEKLIAHLEKGTEIFLILNDDTGIIGTVERNVLCWEDRFHSCNTRRLKET